MALRSPLVSKLASSLKGALWAPSCGGLLAEGGRGLLLTTPGLAPATHCSFTTLSRWEAVSGTGGSVPLLRSTVGLWSSHGVGGPVGAQRHVTGPTPPAAAPSSGAVGQQAGSKGHEGGATGHPAAAFSTQAISPAAVQSSTSEAHSTEHQQGVGLAYMLPRPALVPGRWQSFAETVFNFQGTGGLVQQYFGVLIPTFTLLLTYNLVGLVPGACLDRVFGAISLGLAVNILLSLTILGFGSWGLHFVSFLIPAGAPLALSPMLVLIELVSYCSRAVSLGFRLFANLTAGHCMLKILCGAGLSPPKGKVIAFASKLGAGTLIAGVVGAFAVTGIEMLACFLQAYVFTMLTCYYINDVLGEPVKLRNTQSALAKAIQSGLQKMPK